MKKQIAHLKAMLVKAKKPKRKRKPSAYNKCIKREIKGKEHKGKAAWRKVFKAAAKACKK